MKKDRLLIENIKISIVSIIGNKLRAILTILIIGIGIMALVGIITATESIKESITSSFSDMGANSFKINSIRSRSLEDTKRIKRNSQITFPQAMEFKKMFSPHGIVSVNINVSSSAIIKYESKKTNPNVSLEGIDENGIANKGLKIERGRSISSSDVDLNKPVAVIGSDIKTTLFGAKSNPIGHEVSVAGKNYEVIGVLESKGASMGRSNDLAVYIPISTASAAFSTPNPNYTISVEPFDARNSEAVVSAAEALFRSVRKLQPKDGNDFEIIQSDALASSLISNISTVVFAAYAIGLITILGATIGLMNIMLVSVNEKTREIGTRKALGATNKSIKQQFLMESVIISQIGGIVGIISGIGIGNIISVITGGAFIIPWAWIGIGVLVCLVVGVLSGYLPALKAAKMDPIEALRHE